jgi:hypothetical protein
MGRLLVMTTIVCRNLAFLYGEAPMSDKNLPS